MPHEKNELVECVAEIWFGGKILRPHAARIGKLARDFKDLEATPKDIMARYRRMRREWPNVAHTPESLIKHWFAFAPPKAREASNGAIQTVGEVIRDEQPINEGEARRLIFKRLAEVAQKEKTA